MTLVVYAALCPGSRLLPASYRRALWIKNRPSVCIKNRQRLGMLEPQAESNKRRQTKNNKPNNKVGQAPPEAGKQPR